MSRLFEPTQLGDLSLRSAIVMAPMTRSRADREGVPSPLAVTYYRQRASAGLILTEGTQPSYQGQGYCRTPGIHTPEQVAGWRAVTDAVHAEGGRIALQIMHVGRVGHPLNQARPVGLVAPSAVAADAKMYTDQEGLLPMATPAALTEEGIAGVIEEHRRATELAFEAGFDGVELHGANGYLGQQFLSTNANLREDRYGGSHENRARFVVETLEAMASVAGASKVGVRLSPGGRLNGLENDDVEGTYRTLLRLLRERPSLAGLAWIHFMSTGWPQEKLYEEAGAPLILTGGYQSAEQAEEALRSTPAAAVGFARLFLANPDLPRRLREGLPLNAPDPSTFFTPGEKGYLDYPSWEERVA